MTSSSGTRPPGCAGVKHDWGGLREGERGEQGSGIDRNTRNLPWFYW